MAGVIIDANGVGDEIEPITFSFGITTLVNVTEPLADSR
jgi:hypothetical protein